MPQKKRARPTVVELPKKAANDSVGLYWRMVKLRDVDIDECIEGLRDDLERGFNEQKKLRTRAQLTLMAFVRIQNACLSLSGTAVSRLQSFFHSDNYRRAAVSFTEFEKHGAVLGDPIERLQAFKAAIAEDIETFKAKNIAEAKTKADFVRQALGDGEEVADNGIDADAKKGLDALLQAGIDDLANEIRKLCDRKLQLTTAKNMLPQLAYLRPVLDEFQP